MAGPWSSLRDVVGESRPFPPQHVLDDLPGLLVEASESFSGSQICPGCFIQLCPGIFQGQSFTPPIIDGQQAPRNPAKRRKVVCLERQAG